GIDGGVVDHGVIGVLAVEVDGRGRVEVGAGDGDRGATLTAPGAGADGVDRGGGGHVGEGPVPAVARVAIGGGDDHVGRPVRTGRGDGVDGGVVDRVEVADLGPVHGDGGGPGQVG